MKYVELKCQKFIFHKKFRWFMPGWEISYQSTNYVPRWNLLAQMRLFCEKLISIERVLDFCRFNLHPDEDSKPRSSFPNDSIAAVFRYHADGGNGLRALPPVTASDAPKPESRTPFDATAISKSLGAGGWDVLLSESSDSDNEGATPKVRSVLPDGSI
jgi:hypothetical protein